MKFRKSNKVGKFEVKKVKNKGAVSKNVVRVALDPLDRDSLPVKQGITSSDVTTGLSYLKTQLLRALCGHAYSQL